jgi:hypothetical protein
MASTEDGSAVSVSFDWGYSPTSLINTANGVEAANVWTAANVAVNSGVTVYMQGRPAQRHPGNHRLHRHLPVRPDLLGVTGTAL